MIWECMAIAIKGLVGLAFILFFIALIVFAFIGIWALITRKFTLVDFWEPIVSPPVTPFEEEDVVCDEKRENWDIKLPSENDDKEKYINKSDALTDAIIRDKQEVS